MIFFENFDASPFGENAKDYYERELFLLLQKIHGCYQLLIVNKDVVENDEDKIRDHLHCNFLNNVNVKASLKLEYHFECEPKEFGQSNGYLDIKVFNKNIFSNSAEYFILECKRLDKRNVRGKSGLNGEYIKNGIMRFVKKQYSCFHRVNGMIGFIVEKMDIAENIEDINFLLKNNFSEANTTEYLTSADNLFNLNYQSNHTDIDGNNFKLFHLMLDLSGNIKVA